MIIRHRSLADWWGTDESALNTILCPSNGACAYGDAAQNTLGTPLTAPSGLPAIAASMPPSSRTSTCGASNECCGFRADFFNLFNIASYGNPDNWIGDSNFGAISSVRSQERHIQLGLHYTF